MSPKLRLPDAPTRGREGAEWSSVTGFGTAAEGCDSRWALNATCLLIGAILKQLNA